MKKGVGSISQRYRSGDPDPDPHQNVTDPLHWWSRLEIVQKMLVLFSKTHLKRIHINDAKIVNRSIIVFDTRKATVAI
jgi:hypothetical protein